MAAPDALINHADAITYWEGVTPDVNGMLGGFPYISRVDLQGSKNFLAKLGVKGKKVDRAVDCGAGIGRITEGLLLGVATTVDIVEPITKFSSVLTDKPGIGQIFPVGLEAWSPDPEIRYDLIWNQWCLGHLTDQELTEYLEKCGKMLNEKGWVIVKENIVSSGTEEDLFDKLDSCVTRTDAKFRELFSKAGMKIKKTELAKGFSPDLFPVRLYALQPK